VFIIAVALLVLFLGMRLGSVFLLATALTALLEIRIIFTRTKIMRSVISSKFLERHFPSAVELYAKQRLLLSLVMLLSLILSLIVTLFFALYPSGMIMWAKYGDNPFPEYVPWIFLAFNMFAALLINYFISSCAWRLVVSNCKK